MPKGRRKFVGRRVEVTVALPAGQVARIRAVARLQGVYVADVFRAAVAAFVGTEATASLETVGAAVQSYLSEEGQG